jgi:hypothetical protein
MNTGTEEMQCKTGNTLTDTDTKPGGVTSRKPPGAGIESLSMDPTSPHLSTGLASMLTQTWGLKTLKGMRRASPFLTVRNAAQGTFLEGEKSGVSK